MIYSILKIYAKFLVFLFFEKVYVIGKDNIPSDKPVILYSTHSNGLLDGIMLATIVDKQISFVGTSTLKNIPVIGWLLRNIGVVFVNRRIDNHSEEGMDLNKLRFNDCIVKLNENGMLGIFPEGRTYPSHEMIEFKTGTARILNLYHETYDEDIYIQPTYIHYEKKGRFRSKVVVSFVTPFKSSKIDSENYKDEMTKYMKEILIKEQTSLIEHIERSKKFERKRSLTANTLIFVGLLFPYLIILPVGRLLAKLDIQIDTMRFLAMFFLLPIWPLIIIFLFQFPFNFILGLIMINIASLSFLWWKEMSS